MTDEFNRQFRKNQETVSQDIEEDDYFHPPKPILSILMDRCEECGNMVSNQETKRNAGICDRCCIQGGK